MIKIKRIYNNIKEYRIYNNIKEYRIYNNIKEYADNIINAFFGTKKRRYLLNYFFSCFVYLLIIIDGIILNVNPSLFSEFFSRVFDTFLSPVVSCTSIAAGIASYLFSNAYKIGNQSASDIARNLVLQEVHCNYLLYLVPFALTLFKYCHLGFSFLWIVVYALLSILQFLAVLFRFNCEKHIVQHIDKNAGTILDRFFGRTRIFDVKDTTADSSKSGDFVFVIFEICYDNKVDNVLKFETANVTDDSKNKCLEFSKLFNKDFFSKHNVDDNTEYYFPCGFNTKTKIMDSFEDSKNFLYSIFDNKNVSKHYLSEIFVFFFSEFESYIFSIIAHIEEYSKENGKKESILYYYSIYSALLYLSFDPLFDSSIVNEYLVSTKGSYIYRWFYCYTIIPLDSIFGDIEEGYDRFSFLENRDEVLRTIRPLIKDEHKTFLRCALYCYQEHLLAENKDKISKDETSKDKISEDETSQDEILVKNKLQNLIFEIFRQENL